MNFIFHKMHGLGNDFVLIDASKQAINLTTQQLVSLAHRKLGVGFDQLLIIQSAESTDDYDYLYRIFNQDGSEVSQCGNGARCVGLYLHKFEGLGNTSWVLKTLSGLMQVKWLRDDYFSVDLFPPKFSPAHIPMTCSEELLTYSVEREGVVYNFAAVNVGNPHICIFMRNEAEYDYVKVGELLSVHPLFPEGVNVGFACITPDDVIKLQVYERGVGLTLACGSGACAVAVSALRLAKISDRIVNVQQPGGDSSVEWVGDEAKIILSGGASYVFEGKYSLL
jgi:diaminopimelate epimerase